MNTLAKYFLQAAALALCLSFLAVAPAQAAKRTGPVVVPENGYATGSDYGSGWKCTYGFIEREDACVAIVVPENGYITERGINWKCNRGYRAVDDECLLIQVPENGYLEASERKGWQCERGFKALRDACIAITVPANAYPTNARFGDEWKCERGYKRSNDSCVMIQVPTNAFLVDISYGPGWKCERGYASVNERGCKKIALPKNAHLSRDGNDWLCNRPYSRKGNDCITK